MDENWYAAEQEIRDRLAEARAAARIRSLTRELHPRVRRPRVIGPAVIRFVSWVWAHATEFPSEHSHGVANVRAATKRG